MGEIEIIDAKRKAFVMLLGADNVRSGFREVTESFADQLHRPVRSHGRESLMKDVGGSVPSRKLGSGAAAW